MNNEPSIWWSIRNRVASWLIGFDIDRKCGDFYQDGVVEGHRRQQAADLVDKQPGFSGPKGKS